jgi:hypothetical protein
MRKSIKVILLSALVLPGAGHFLLKRYLAGMVLAGTALVCFYFIISEILQRALEISDKIQRGEIQPDVTAISDLLSHQPVSDNAHLINIAWTILIITWLTGIVDSYRVAQKQIE